MKPHPTFGLVLIGAIASLQLLAAAPPASPHPIFQAIRAGDSTAVRAHLKNGADLQARDESGDTPLMAAALNADAAMLEVLLEAGADVNATNEAGATALLRAATFEDKTRLLVAKGADVKARSKAGNSALLLARGAEVNAEGGQDVDNYLGVPQTPLMLARRRGDTPIVHALLKAGAKDLSAPTATVNKAPLAFACAKSTAESVLRALPSLTRTAEDSITTFLRHATRQDCVSCHQQSVPLAALSLAHVRGFPTDREAARHQAELMKRSLLTGHIQNQHTLHEVNLQATFHPEPGIMAGYNAMNFELEHEPASALTDGMLHQLVAMQQADGRWAWNLPRVPIQASDLAATASAVHALKTFGIPAQRKDLESRVQRARKWLLEAAAETNDERVHQLLGLAWAGEPAEVLQRFVDAVAREQRADGGWGQLAGLDSDAYATGQSLYALLEGGKVSAGDPVVRRGLEFLLRTQLADGTWHVRTRAHPFQPPMDSGFPHGRDGWISAAATGWAVMALSLATDPATVPTSTTPVADVAKSPGSASIPAFVGSIEFARDIQPLIERSCVACHSGEQAKGGLRMTDRNAVLKGGKRGEPVVVPGKPDDSQLLHVVQDTVKDLEMPPLAKRAKYPALSNEETGRLRAWIEQGAAWPEGVTLRAPAE